MRKGTLMFLIMASLIGCTQSSNVNYDVSEVNYTELVLDTLPASQNWEAIDGVSRSGCGRYFAVSQSLTDALVFYLLDKEKKNTKRFITDTSHVRITQILEEKDPVVIFRQNSRGSYLVDIKLPAHEFKKVEMCLPKASRFHSGF